MVLSHAQVGGERAAVLGLHPGSGAVSTLATLETDVPAGTKKAPKLYTAACHPLMPHIVAVGANSGARGATPASVSGPEAAKAE